MSHMGFVLQGLQLQVLVGVQLTSCFSFFSLIFFLSSANFLELDEDFESRRISRCDVRLSSRCIFILLSEALSMVPRGSRHVALP